MHSVDNYESFESETLDAEEDIDHGRLNIKNISENLPGGNFSSSSPAF